jgi:thioesterase domain-containing protein
VTVPTFLAELRRRNIQVWMEGDQLRCTAPVGALTPAMRDQLRQDKSAIIAFLQSAEALARQERAIVPVQPKGERIPVFASPGHNGNVFSFRFLAQALGEDQPLFGLQPPGVDGECDPISDVGELAGYFAERIRAFRPEGPYIIAGHCAGGSIAFEVARQLQAQGAQVSLVALFGTVHPSWFRRLPQFLARLGREADWLGHHLNTLAPLSNEERRRYIAAKLAERRRQSQARREAPPEPAPDPELLKRARVEAATMQALSRYTPRHFEGRLALFFPSDKWMVPGHPMLGWRGVASEVEEYCGPEGCEGDVMLHEPNVRMITEQFQGCLRSIGMKGAAAEGRPERASLTTGLGPTVAYRAAP